MKKIALIWMGLILTFAGYSQSFNKVFKSEYLTYVDGEWVVQESAKPEAMYVILDGYNIKINNAHHSKYKTYGTPEKSIHEDFVCYSWGCVDDNGKDCTFMLKDYGSKGSIMIFAYLPAGYAFQYFTTSY